MTNHHHHEAPEPTEAPGPLATIFPGADVLYFSDPRVAASYHANVGDFASVKDPDERAWLVSNHWAYSAASPSLPAAYWRGNNGAWAGYQPPSPSPPPASRRRT